MPNNQALQKDLKRKGEEVLVYTCAHLKENEKALIVSDKETSAVGDAIEAVAKTVSSKVVHLTVAPFKMHGQEPPADVAESMLKSDVIFGVTRMSMAHTLARQKAAAKGARYLSLPDYSLDLLESESLQIDFREMVAPADRLAEILSGAKRITITSEAGTNLSLNVAGRRGNSAPGLCQRPGGLASPPDVEANIAPVEEHSEGVLVVDGSIPCAEIGVLKERVKVEIRRGKMTNIDGPYAPVLNKLFDQQRDEKSRVLGEIGFGLNPKAELKGVMLEDEGCLGTIHCGFGSNTALGGRNQVPFHLDMIVRYPSVDVDGRVVLTKGKLVI